MFHKGAAAVIVKGLDKKKKPAAAELEMRRTKSDGKGCVICVGSKGSGKSSIIKLFASKPHLRAVEEETEAAKFQAYDPDDEDDQVSWINTRIDWQEKIDMLALQVPIAGSMRPF